MMINTVFKNKGAAVITINAFETVRDAMYSMIEHKIAALVLTNGAQVIGVVSERDILQAISHGGTAILDAPVGNIVTGPLVAVSPEETTRRVMHLMTHSHLAFVARRSRAYESWCPRRDRPPAGRGKGTHLFQSRDTAPRLAIEYCVPGTTPLKSATPPAAGNSHRWRSTWKMRNYPARSASPTTRLAMRSSRPIRGAFSSISPLYLASLLGRAGICAFHDNAD